MIDRPAKKYAPSAGNRLVDGLVIGLVTLLLAVQYWSFPPLDTQLMLVLACIVLLAWWRLGGVFVILVQQSVLLFTEPSNYEIRLDWSCLVLPVLTLILSATIERSLALRRIGPKLGWRENIANMVQVARRPLDCLRWSAWSFVTRLSASAALSTVIAVAIVWLVPLDHDSQRWVRLRPTELRGIVMAAWLTGGAIGAAIVIGEFKWRWLSSSQARVYIRGLLASWIEGEWRYVVRRSRRLRHASIRLNQRTADSTDWEPIEFDDNSRTAK